MKKRFVLWAFVKPAVIPRTSTITYLPSCTIFPGVQKCDLVKKIKKLGLSLGLVLGLFVKRHLVIVSQTFNQALIYP